MELRFSENEIDRWAQRYVDRQQKQDSKREFEEEQTLLRLRDRIVANRVLAREELERVARWKSPRRVGRVKNNAEDYVEAITGFALQTPNERARIEVLTILDGVKWPTASAVLHLFHVDNYPILDVRALWSVGTGEPAHYTFDFWWRYVEFCRRIAHRTGHTMCTLDRALWEYSNENMSDGS